MSFKPGEKIRLHDGRVFKVGKGGSLPRMQRKHLHEKLSTVRGFVRGELVDCVTGDVQRGDWHENVITQYGHQQIVRNYAGLASSASSVAATVTSDLGLARFWGIGYHTQAQSSNFSTQTAIDSTEYGLASTGGVSRATVSVGSQLLSGTWTLSQSFQYASSQITHAQTVNCIAQYHNSSVGAGTAHSLATFASSTKGTTQALNVTYNFVFSTVLAYALFGSLAYLYVKLFLVAAAMGVFAA
jgi:hypothetical protein